LCSALNGKSILTSINTIQPNAIITSDYSGSWGCGAWSGREWFQLKWINEVWGYHITVKEMLPIVIAATIWGKKWKGGTILVRGDSMVAVLIINHGTSKQCT